ANDGLVVADGTELGRAANSADERTVNIVATRYSAVATKDWRRAADNPAPGADNSEVRDLPVPAAGEGWPVARMTVGGGSTTGNNVPVDSLVIEEPAFTTLEDLVDGSAPFAVLDLLDVVDIT